jgi:hypothetical protein
MGKEVATAGHSYRFRRFIISSGRLKACPTFRSFWGGAWGGRFCKNALPRELLPLRSLRNLRRLSSVLLYKFPDRGFRDGALANYPKAFVCKLHHRRRPSAGSRPKIKDQINRPTHQRRNVAHDHGIRTAGDVSARRGYQSTGSSRKYTSGTPGRHSDPYFTSRPGKKSRKGSRGSHENGQATRPESFHHAVSQPLLGLDEVFHCS